MAEPVSMTDIGFSSSSRRRHGGPSGARIVGAIVCAFLTASFLTSTAAGEGGKAPAFEDYPAETTGLEGDPSMPAGTSALPPAALDAIQYQLERGANFAGSAILAQWGCGTRCVAAGIFDLQSGVWFELPFAMHRPIGAENKPYSFRVDSRLLVATGVCNEQTEGRFAFMWDGQSLVSLDAQKDQCITL